MITAAMPAAAAASRANRAGTTLSDMSAAAGQSIVSRMMTPLVKYTAYCGSQGPASEAP